MFLDIPISKPDPPKKVKKKPVPVAPGLADVGEESDQQMPSTLGELGEAEVPLGSKFGEKKSPRQSKGLPPLNGPGPSSMRGPGDLPPLGKG